MAPGGSTKITVRVKTDRLKKRNKFSKATTIYTNDPKQPQAKVWMSGKITQVINWEPRRVNLVGLVGADTYGTAQIFVPDENVTISLESVTPKAGKISLEDISEMESGRRWELKFKCEAKDTTRSVRDTMEITVRVNDQRTLTIPMPVTAKFRELIEVSPRNTVTFNKSDTKKILKHGNSISKEVTVKSSDPNIAFRVTGVELLDLPEGLFEAHISEVRAGAEYQVQVTLNEYVERRYVRGKVRIKTDHPSFPSKDLRVFARFEEKPQVERGE